MSSQDNKFQRIKEFFKSPLGLSLILIIALLFIVLIALSIAKTTSDDDSDYYWYSEIDPASGEEIWFGSPTDGNAGMGEVRYAGFDESIIAGGVTAEQYRIFQSAVENYASENDITLTRVSYLKDSYHLKASYVFEFKIVLNVDQETLQVTLDSSAGWKNILGAFVTLTNESGQEVYKLVIDETILCDYQTFCELEDDGD